MKLMNGYVVDAEEGCKIEFEEVFSFESSCRIMHLGEFEGMP